MFLSNSMLKILYVPELIEFLLKNVRVTFHVYTYLLVFFFGVTHAYAEGIDEIKNKFSQLIPQGLYGHQ